ncbi:tetraspanin-8-like [Styela clava]
MACCKSFAKFTLMLFNIFVWIAGGALLGMGIYLRVGGHIESVITVADIHMYYSGCYLMMFCGGAMFAIGFVGCCGAMTENKCLLGTYFIVLLLLFIVQVGLGIYAAVAHNQINDAIKTGFNKTLSNGNDTSDVGAQSAISMERNLKCCGLLKGCQDWEKAVAWGCQCNKGDANCTLASSLGCTVGETGGDGYIWENDCYDAAVDYVEDHVWTVVGICLGIGFTELFGMVLAIALMKLSKRSDYESFYA